MRAHDESPAGSLAGQRRSLVPCRRAMSAGARTQGGRGNERARLALVAGHAGDCVAALSWPQPVHAAGDLHVGVPRAGEGEHRSHALAGRDRARLVTGARVQEVPLDAKGRANGAPVYRSRGYGALAASPHRAPLLQRSRHACRCVDYLMRHLTEGPYALDTAFG